MPQPKDQPVDELDYNTTYIEFVKEKDVIKKFNLFLKLHCQDDYAHLIDSDDNAGEFMRRAIQAECNRARIDELKGLPSKYPLGNVMGSDIERRVVQLQQIMKEVE